MVKCSAIGRNLHNSYKVQVTFWRRIQRECVICRIGKGAVKYYLLNKTQKTMASMTGNGSYAYCRADRH